MFGNVDDDLPALRAAMKAGGHTCHERQGELSWPSGESPFCTATTAGCSSQLVSGGEYRPGLPRPHARGGASNCVAARHVLNPGALYRAPYHSLALVELPQLEITEIRVG